VCMLWPNRFSLCNIFLSTGLESQR
jgi:hypothetical protein